MLLYRRRDDTRRSGPLSVLFFSTFSAIVFCKGQSLLDLNTPVSGQGCPNKHSSIFTFLKLIYLIYRFFFFGRFCTFVHPFVLPSVDFSTCKSSRTLISVQPHNRNYYDLLFFFSFNKMPAL